MRESVRNTLTRDVADRLVLALVAGIALLGGYSTLRAYWQLRTTGGMMSGMLVGMPGTNPVWNAVGTLVAVSVVLGAYAFTRRHLEAEAETNPDSSTPARTDRTATESAPRTGETAALNADAESVPVEKGNDRTDANDVLAVLPVDERRVLEPILDSPGVTQVELRGRSDFSKAKVSQTVSELEDRGLIYREPQGRTYRVYPGELLTEQVRR